MEVVVSWVSFAGKRRVLPVSSNRPIYSLSFSEVFKLPANRPIYSLKFFKLPASSLPVL